MIYDDVQFTKNDWRNRNQIMSAQGKSWLTIPVKHKQGQLIHEVEVSDPQWQIKHWDRIKQCYSSAPFFKDFSPAFEEFYRGAEIYNLSEANRELIGIVNKLLGVTTVISDSRNFSKDYGPSGRLLHIVQQLEGNRYLSGPAAKSYLNESIFDQAGIEVSYINYSGYPTYKQLSDTFAHDVSVLDVLFNCGPSSREMLKSFNTTEHRN